MSRNDLWKWLVLAMLAVLSAYVVIPPKEKIRLGLDLSGGTSFTVAIDQKKLIGNIKAGNPELTEEEVKNQVSTILRDADTRSVEVIRNRIDKTGINEPVIQSSGKNHRITIQLPGINAEQRAAAEKSIQSAAFLEFKLVHAKNDLLVEQVLKSGKAPEGYVMAEDGRSYKRGTNYNDLVKDPGYISRLSLFQVPDPRYAFMPERFVESSGQVRYRPVYVLRRAELTGAALDSASVERETMTGRIEIALKFNAKGTAEFARLTKAYAPRGSRNRDSDTGRQLAIVLDDTLYSAPVLKTEIPNGQAVIEGNFSPAEATLLRNILNAGSLPAPMQIIEKHSIESTLGADAIHSGLYAAILGVVLVGLFMLIYYTYCGLIADVALILDIVLLPAGLVVASNILGIFVRDNAFTKSALDLPVITMPGIAGLVLTMGMAVDANVLIFERMREEFALGKSARAAVAAGYDRAFLAIFDSNITTLLTAAILFIFGVGPIRGYAITLSAGVIISMFTALVVTRLIFNATVPEARVKPYKMFQMCKNPHFDYLKCGKVCCLTSLAIILVSCGIFFGRVLKAPASVLSVDFTGGASITYAYKTRADIGEVRKVLDPIVQNDLTLQYQSTPDGMHDRLLVKTSQVERDGKNMSDLVLEGLQKNFKDNGFTLAGEENVGSAVGADLKNAAKWSIILSLIGILIYVSIRFEFGFALGAVVALAHDAFITLGLYSILPGHHQMSLTVVAALLTIVGYSVNDTIVIFDRVRENLRLDQKTDFRTLCNNAVNATLSRSLITSLTTILAAVALYAFGGGAINDFAFAMLIGLVAGTYSSIFISPAITYWWYRGRRPSFAAAEKK